MTGPQTKGIARPIRLFGDPVLRTPTDRVVDFDESLARLVEDMFASMYAADGVGLAANQIGVGLSVFVYDCPDASGKRHVGHVVNPVLVSTAGDVDDDIEGCLSVPGLHYENPRPSYAAVEGVDVAGAPVRVAGDGVLARCLQHETDHLQGLLFLDRLHGRTKRRAMREVMSADWSDLD
ncbi:MAG TPA: peptide deformylase [Mycobacteriales bacterium]|nr:peptide deformylase [Mycobacteriales bacterium]